MLNRKVKILAISLCLIAILIGLTGLSIAAEKSKVRFTVDWPISLDPAVIGAAVEHLTAHINLFDPLVSAGAGGSILPNIAKSWDISPDGLVYTFYLRSDVKFHNGSELTAEDVKFSMDRFLATGGGKAFFWIGKVKETKVIDKYTVEFYLEKPYGPFISTLPYFFIVNKDLIMKNIKSEGLYGDMGDYGTGYAADNDVASGPYMVKDYKRAEYLIMEKNPNYFLDISTAPDEFKMIGASELVLIKTLMSQRELEMTNKWMSVEAYQSLAEIEGVEFAQLPSTQALHIQLNTKKPPLDDVHVRRALAWSFDYDAAVNLIPGSVQARGPVSMAVPGSDPNSFQYHRDLEKAKLELKQSKYYGNFDEYPIEIQWNDDPKQEKIAMLLMMNASEIGLTVNVVETTWSLLISDSAKIETTPDIHIIGIEARFPEAGSPLSERYGTGSAGTYYQTEWLLDPVYDKMIEDAFAIIDMDERFAKYSELTKYIIDLCPTIFVSEMPELRAYQAAYMDWPAAQGEIIPWQAYNNTIRLIKVYPEKREELLK